MNFTDTYFDLEPCTVSHFQDLTMDSMRDKEEELFSHSLGIPTFCLPLNSSLFLEGHSQDNASWFLKLEVQKCTGRPDCKSNKEIDEFVSRLVVYNFRY